MLSGSCRIRSGLLLGVLGCATSQAVAQEVELQRLSDHVIVMRLPGISYTNIVAVSTARGLVVIDTESNPVTMRPLKQAAERAFGRDDWALVINTHPHFHHAGGNALFEGAQIIGHESFPRVVREHDLPRPMEPPGPFHGHVQQLEAELAEVADPERAFSLRQAITFLTEANQELLAGFELRTPTIGVHDRLTLDLGDRHIRLLYTGQGISHSSLFVHIVEDGLVVTPGIGGHWLAGVGNADTDAKTFRRWLAVLAELADPASGIDTIIPCHAPPTDRRELLATHEYLEDMAEGLAEARRKGLSFEEVKERFAFERRYRHLGDLFVHPDRLVERHQGNLARIWQWGSGPS